MYQDVKFSMPEFILIQGNLRDSIKQQIQLTVDLETAPDIIGPKTNKELAFIGTQITRLAGSPSQINPYIEHVSSPTFDKQRGYGWHVDQDDNPRDINIREDYTEAILNTTTTTLFADVKARFLIDELELSASRKEVLRAADYDSLSLYIRSIRLTTLLEAIQKMHGIHWLEHMAANDISELTGIQLLTKPLIQAAPDFSVSIGHSLAMLHAAQAWQSGQPEFRMFGR